MLLLRRPLIFLLMLIEWYFILIILLLISYLESFIFHIIFISEWSELLWWAFLVQLCNLRKQTFWVSIRVESFDLGCTTEPQIIRLRVGSWLQGFLFELFLKSLFEDLNAFFIELFSFHEGKNFTVYYLDCNWVWVALVNEFLSELLKQHLLEVVLVSCTGRGTRLGKHEGGSCYTLGPIGSEILRCVNGGCSLHVERMCLWALIIEVGFG
jgi:hypothetical protein